MTESLVQSSDAAWLEAKENARTAVRRAGLMLLGLAVERAVSRAESVIDYIEAHGSDTDSPAEEADSSAREADSAADEADSPGQDEEPGEVVAQDGRGVPAGAAGGERPAGGRAHDDGGGESGLKNILSDLLKAGLQLAADFVERVVGRLEEIVAGGGALPAAGLGAGIAALVGKNPIWGAIKGAFSALSPGAKVALIIALVLAAILLPVTILLLLIAVVIVVVVLAVKTRSRRT